MDSLIKASAHALAAGDPLAPLLGPVFIAAREFARVLFNPCMPTIYLTLPLSCAHRAVVRG